MRGKVSSFHQGIMWSKRWKHSISVVFFGKRQHNQEVPDTVQVTLRYQGRDVNDGTMPIADVITALQGFSGAYGKIASRTTPSAQHQIRVSDINKSSFAVVVLAWVADHADLVKGTAVAAAAVAGMIIKLIDFTKKNKGKEPKVEIKGDGNVVLMGDNTQLVMSKELYEVYKTKALDAELSKVAKPLEESRIDRVEISALDTETGDIEKTEISASDKVYFQVEESTTTTSRPTQIVGTLVSLNKESNRGSFRMQNGTTVRYRLGSGDPTGMHGAFVHPGPVRVECIASFDSDLQVRSLEITSITPLQMQIAFDEATESKSQEPD